jgi:hypothetical protein
VAALAGGVSYDKGWLAAYRAAQVARVARIDAVAKQSLADADDARSRLAGVDKAVEPRRWRDLRARAVFSRTW